MGKISRGTATIVTAYLYPCFMLGPMSPAQGHRGREQDCLCMSA